MPKQFQVSEKVWWVDSEVWEVLAATITEVGPSHCTIRVATPARYIYYVEPCMLYREEGAALLAVITATSKQIEKSTKKLDALFEKRNALQQQLYPEPQGTNTHG